MGDRPPEIAWSDGHRTPPPAASVQRDGDLLVTAVEGSDAWRTTSSVFVHDSEHALLTPFPDTAVEVEFTAAFAEQFDQAGVFVRVGAEHWIKTGVEFGDGGCQLGAVVTDGMSDCTAGCAPNRTPACTPDGAGRGQRFGVGEPGVVQRGHRMRNRGSTEDGSREIGRRGPR